VRAHAFEFEMRAGSERGNDRWERFGEDTKAVIPVSILRWTGSVACLFEAAASSRSMCHFSQTIG